MDGVSFTFNGLGEYFLSKSSAFQLQGRTATANFINPSNKATVFSSIASRQLIPESDTVEFRINSGSGTIGKLTSI